jgi:RimJ/RimL family protein N-acetyltransferase
MQIQGERVVLRPWREGDEAALVRHANSRAVWRNLTDRFPHPYGLDDARRWIALNRKLGDPPANLAIVLEGEAVGGAGTERKTDLAQRTAEVGYWLGEPFWGRGLASDALRLVTRYAFERFDYERLEAYVLAWNPASCRVLEKAGYTLEGRQRNGAFKDGQLVDTWLYARLRAD